MKRMLTGVSVVLAVLALAGAGVAAEKRGTAAEAEKMVKKAVAYMKSNGQAAAFAEINNPRGRFTDRDLYVLSHT